MIRIEIQGVDWSDYVTSCGSIPILVRNKDLSLVAEGFTFDAGMGGTLEMNPPAVGETIVVKKDATPILYGYVKSTKADYDRGVYSVDVENLLVKLEDIMLAHNEIGDILADVVSDDPWAECSFDATSNTVYIATHGLYDEYGIVFRTDGKLPTGIEAGRVYYVRRIDADNIQLRYFMGTTGTVDFDNDGDGRHEHNYADVSEWNFRDNENAPNVTLKRLLVKIFEKAGLTLATSEIEEQTIFQKSVYGTLTNYNLKTLCIDEYMMYCMNLPKAMHYSLIDDPDTEADYSSSKLSLWEFVSFLCGIFGLTIVPDSTGHGKYKLAIISGTFAYEPDEALSFVEENIQKDGGGYTLFVKRMDVRTYYTAPTETDIDDKEKTVVGGGKEEIEIYTNFKLLFRDLRTGATSGAVLPTESYFITLDKVAGNRKREWDHDRREREMTLREAVLATNVVEMRFDPEGEKYEVMTVDYD